MPFHPQTTAAGSLPRGILLVEGYSALGVAISSALRKFAPDCEVRVAHTFDDAEATAEELEPALFVLDLDPPPRGEIEFFQKIKERYPEARVLVIAAGTSRQLHAARGNAGALHFIEKPFVLPEFGAEVQMLLSAPPGVTTGALKDLHLVDILQLKCLAGSSAILRVETADHRSGTIYFRKGQIIHAATEDETGQTALEDIVLWPPATLSETPLPLDPPKTIESSWDATLLHVVRKLHRVARRAPPNRKPATGRKILVVDDTETLLVFVAEILAGMDENFQVLTARTGAEGLQLAASERPDLLLLDYSLTDTTGDQVCRQLLENETTAGIPILMMSGHLNEMAATSRSCRNVVATLAKPFLSGALITAVKQVITAQGFQQSVETKSAEPASPVTPTEEASSNAGSLPETSPTLSSNGRSKEPPVIEAEPASPPPEFATSLEKISFPPETEAPSIPLEIVEPESRPKSFSIGKPPIGSEEKVVAPAQSQPAARELQVTLAFEVQAVTFTSSWKVETAVLQPLDRIVAVRMSAEARAEAATIESGFRFGEISLVDGRLSSVRLVPAKQPPHLPVPSRSFPVGQIHLEPGPRLSLGAAAVAGMRLRLTAWFSLLSVELSPSFEVGAILLEFTQRPLTAHLGTQPEGREFSLEEARVDSGGQLLGMVIRARS